VAARSALEARGARPYGARRRTSRGAPDLAGSRRSSPRAEQPHRRTSSSTASVVRRLPGRRTPRLDINMHARYVAASCRFFAPSPRCFRCASSAFRPFPVSLPAASAAPPPHSLFPLLDPDEGVGSVRGPGFGPRTDPTTDPATQSRRSLAGVQRRQHSGGLPRRPPRTRGTPRGGRMRLNVGFNRPKCHVTFSRPPRRGGDVHAQAERGQLRSRASLRCHSDVTHLAEIRHDSGCQADTARTAARPWPAHMHLRR
ncbi:MAG: hypothetical protein QOI82_680, partial [Actinomycetota bacterium]|nr:hypothetical protein [Actinomycetota bacterium]